METEQETVYPVVDNVEALQELIGRVKSAQITFATYSQEQVDRIFKAAAAV